MPALFESRPKFNHPDDAALRLRFARRTMAIVKIIAPLAAPATVAPTSMELLPVSSPDVPCWSRLPGVIGLSACDGLPAGDRAGTAAAGEDDTLGAGVDEGIGASVGFPGEGAGEGAAEGAALGAALGLAVGASVGLGVGGIVGAGVIFAQDSGAPGRDVCA